MTRLMLGCVISVTGNSPLNSDRVHVNVVRCTRVSCNTRRVFLKLLAARKHLKSGHFTTRGTGYHGWRGLEASESGELLGEHFKRFMAQLI